MKKYLLGKITFVWQRFLLAIALYLDALGKPYKDLFMLSQEHDQHDHPTTTS